MNNNLENKLPNESNIDDFILDAEPLTRKQKTEDPNQQRPLMENFSLAGFSFDLETEPRNDPKIQKTTGILNSDIYDDFVRSVKEDFSLNLFEESENGKLIFCGGSSFLDNQQQAEEYQNTHVQSKPDSKFPEWIDSTKKEGIDEISVLSFNCNVWELEKESNKFKECGPCHFDLTDIPSKDCSRIVIRSTLNGRLLADSVIWGELEVWSKSSGGVVVSTLNKLGVLIFHYIKISQAERLRSAVSERIMRAPSVGSGGLDNTEVSKDSNGEFRDTNDEEDIQETDGDELMESEEVEEEFREQVDPQESLREYDEFEESQDWEMDSDEGTKLESSEEVIVISSDSEHVDIPNKTEDSSVPDSAEVMSSDMNSVTEDSHSMDAFYSVGDNLNDQSGDSHPNTRGNYVETIFTQNDTTICSNMDGNHVCETTDGSNWPGKSEMPESSKEITGALVDLCSPSVPMMCYSKGHEELSGIMKGSLDILSDDCGMKGTLFELNVHAKKYNHSVKCICYFVDETDSSRLVVYDVNSHVLIDHVIENSTIVRSTGNTVIMTASKADGSLGMFKISMSNYTKTFYDSILQRMNDSCKQYSNSKRQARDIS